ncbi:MAG: ThiF family adenylyltransferase [bacterium]|nr:ThiF family adenylyltransferase [bacterium]
MDSPYKSKLFPILARDPIGDEETRLCWHAKRALEWLHAATEGTLLGKDDPFELPSKPAAIGLDESKHIIVYDESIITFPVWKGFAGYGVAKIIPLQDISSAMVISCFFDQNGKIIRKWTGRSSELTTGIELDAFWWLWPAPIIVPPWEAPGSWGDLRFAGQTIGIDVDAVLRQIARRIRGKDTPTALLVGYPIPKRVGESNVEIHWDALALPPLLASGPVPSGFRQNEMGFWQRDRNEAFMDGENLKYIAMENWSTDRIQVRGHLPDGSVAANIAIIGVGSLGSSIGELLVRAGIKTIGLIDDDIIEAGNVCRHVATLIDVGKKKVEALGSRLLQITPHVQVQMHAQRLPLIKQKLHDLLEPYDLIIDCTASNEVLEGLALGWWSIPKLFLSASVGHRARRMFIFTAFGNQFPVAEYHRQIEPWLRNESASWAEEGEILEGPGCWSPLFPARYDDMMLAAIVTVKMLEKFTATPPTAPLLHVFEQKHDSKGFSCVVCLNEIPVPEDANSS